VYTRTVIRTNLTVQQAAERIAGLVGQPFASNAPFVGTVQADRFKVHRVITGTRGFEVIVSGAIVAAPAGAELQMVIRIAIPALIFQAACLAASLAAMSIGGTIDAMAIVLLSLVVLALTAQFFVRERRRTLQALRAVPWVDPVPS
jgi:hypothetical protein